MRRLNHGTSTLEYAILIAITAAALIAMSGYVKKAISGKWRSVGDSFGFGRQYESGGN